MVGQSFGSNTSSSQCLLAKHNVIQSVTWFGILKIKTKSYQRTISPLVLINRMNNLTKKSSTMSLHLICQRALEDHPAWQPSQANESTHFDTCKWWRGRWPRQGVPVHSSLQAWVYQKQILFYLDKPKIQRHPLIFEIINKIWCTWPFFWGICLLFHNTLREKHDSRNVKNRWSKELDYIDPSGNPS